MEYHNLNPFYERLIKYFPGSFAGKILFSMLLGLLVLAIHYQSIGAQVFEKKGWILSGLITAAMLCLFYATHTFRSLLPKMGMRLDSNSNNSYRRSIQLYLSNKNFVISGLTFGVLNSVMGILFGLPNIYIRLSDKIVILGLYFVAGFVCGLAVLGIIGVTKCIIIFSDKASKSFDYTSPDSCGGTQFIGGPLVVFSSVTLFVGVLISAYIFNTNWVNKDSDWIIMFFWFWIVFPYLMSLFVLFVPAIAINKALSAYKLKEEVQLDKRLSKIYNKLEADNLTAEEKTKLRGEYEFRRKLRKDLHRMRTWPFGVSANLTYFAVMGSNIFISTKSVGDWISDKL